MQRIVYAILGLVAAVLLAGLLIPRILEVETDILIDAPASVVFVQADSLSRLVLWAPPAENDPTAVLRFSGPDRGEGATVGWSAGAAGSGTMTVAESIPYQYVSYVLNRGEPGEAVGWLELEPVPGGTRVTRGFEHDYGYNLVGRYFGLLWQNVVERDQRMSLERLKALAEALPRTDFADLDAAALRVEAQEIAYVSTTAAPGTAAVSEALGASYLEILTDIEARGLRTAGAPLAILRGYEGARRRFDAAIPVSAGVDVSGGAARRGVRFGTSYAGRAVRARHTGSYERLGNTHRKLESYLAAHGIEQDGAPWEVYVSDPGRTPEHELVTDIYYPVRETSGGPNRSDE